VVEGNAREVLVATDDVVSLLAEVENVNHLTIPRG
jgi:hypothetical protein